MSRVVYPLETRETNTEKTSTIAIGSCGTSPMHRPFNTATLGRRCTEKNNTKMVEKKSHKQSPGDGRLVLWWFHDGGNSSRTRQLSDFLGPPGIGHVVERFTILDDEKRIMEAVQVEGGYLALGFTSIRIRLEFTEKSPESTIIKSTVEYEIDEKLAQNVSFVSFKTLKVMAEAVEKHLIANKASA